MPKKPIIHPRKRRERLELLRTIRNLKMASSVHAYVRGNTAKFYEWLENSSRPIPSGPPVWICGDCHVGNLGPVANAEGKIEIQIRDLDQTTIGNPAHDLIRLALSLAMAARASDLAGITTANMLEEIVKGYCDSLLRQSAKRRNLSQHPETMKIVLKRALKRRWRHLADERIEGVEPTIPLGKNFWPLFKDERKEIDTLARQDAFRKLLTSLQHRNDDDAIDVLDAAYWVKGCSSLERLRYAVLVGVGKATFDDSGMCLVDFKQAVPSVAPKSADAEIPRGHAERVVEGARHLAPSLGDRMLAATVGDTPVVIRELLPQDLKVDIDHLTTDEAKQMAFFLAEIVGRAHGRQMSSVQRQSWARELRKSTSKTLDAPSWLWSSVLDLIALHEVAYLEHCRRFASGKLA